MDPNEALRALRDAYGTYEDCRGTGSGNASIDDAADRMRDAAVALDAWLSRGGFLPDAWRQSLPKTINGMSADDWADVRDERDYGKRPE